ncbi:MAG: hypothetical protein Q4A90_00130 [Streptococcus sp.]|nr:hypothetical protein [Streptococcus sp.]
MEASRFAYIYDKDSEGEMYLPTFPLNLVTGVQQSRDELDKKSADI